MIYDEEDLYFAEILSFKKLPSKWKDIYKPVAYAKFLVIRHKGKILHVETDQMEPDDANFLRDLEYISEYLLEAYRLGFKDSTEFHLNKKD